MKSLIYAVLLSLLVWNANSETSRQKLNCDKIETILEGSSPGSEGWRTMASISAKPNGPSCLTLMKNQAQEEMKASLTYLSMASHFSKDSVNRPGFAKFFFHSANEEREHATKFLEYLTMRGEFAENGQQPLLDYKPGNIQTTWENGAQALKDALELEISVTKLIRKIIITCEKGDITKDETGYQPKGNDYHLVDYLTGEFMDEQHKGQRDLAGMISTLNKMHHAQGSLAEFLFDKKLLKGELF